MGMLRPDPGEAHKLVLKLKRTREGRPDLTQQEYEAYKNAVQELAKKYGAEIEAREYVVVSKKDQSGK